MIVRLSGSTWRYHDEAGCTSYLVVGKNKAAMIDCGMGRTEILPIIREITPLPVELLLTHAHPDHYGAAKEFDSIWLHEKDAEALPEMERAFGGMGVPGLPPEKVRRFTGERLFDLGGICLRPVELFGHTPGSTVFVDEADRAIFSGDAVGSGDIVLMAVPMAYDLASYRLSLKTFLARSEPWAEFVWHAGHYHQADRPGRPGANTPCRKLACDMVELCDQLLSGRLRGEEVRESFSPSGRAWRAYWRTAGIVYLESQINTIE